MKDFFFVVFGVTFIASILFSELMILSIPFFLAWHFISKLLT